MEPWPTHTALKQVIVPEDAMRTLIALTAALLLSAPAAHAAMTDAECDTAFMAVDTNKDGSLAEPEGARYFAIMRVADKAPVDGKISKAAFVASCKAGTFDIMKRVNDAGAPLPGANSFTEGQARDRAMAAGYMAVSPLTKDDKGVWRGTATSEGKSLKLAVDFKGNVVAN
jgi:hypothetical protein